MKIKRTSMLVAAMFAALTIMSANQALADGGCCPECGVKVCKATVEKAETEKTVFSTETRDVCVKGFRWPWEKCCGPKCGHVRTVCVLKKEKVKCESCGYKWEVTTVDRGCRPGCSLRSRGCLSGKCGNDGCNSDGCNSGGCGAGGCATRRESGWVTADETSVGQTVQPNPSPVSEYNHVQQPVAPPVPVVATPPSNVIGTGAGE